MGIIKSLPILDRPREKAIRYGLDNLSDIELLAVLIGNGYKGENVIELSTHLISKYAGLENLSNIQFSELKKNKGIKNTKALILAAVFEMHRRLSIKKLEAIDSIIDAEYLYNKYLPLIGESGQEQMVVVVLSRNKRIIHESILFKGDEKSIYYSFDKIADLVRSYGGKYYYLIHNHPSGDFDPSQQDKIGTQYLLMKSKKAGITLLDHIIISENGYYSFQKMKKTKISC